MKRIQSSCPYLFWLYSLFWFFHLPCILITIALTGSLQPPKLLHVTKSYTFLLYSLLSFWSPCANLSLLHSQASACLIIVYICTLFWSVPSLSNISSFPTDPVSSDNLNYVWWPCPRTSSSFYCSLWEAVLKSIKWSPYKSGRIYL